MPQPTQFRETLREELARALGPEVTVTDEYPGTRRRYPQRGLWVAVGIREITARPGRYLGEREGRQLAGQSWQVTLQLELSCPRIQGAGALTALFDRIAGLLLAGSGRFGLTGLTCGAAAFSRERDAFCALCTADCTLEDTTEEPGGQIEAFEIRRTE